MSDRADADIAKNVACDRRVRCVAQLHLEMLVGLLQVVLPHLHRHGLARLPRRERHQLIGERLVVHPRRRAAEVRRRRQHCHCTRRRRPRQGHRKVVRGEPGQARPLGLRHPLTDPKGMHVVVVDDRANAGIAKNVACDRRVRRVAQLHLEMLVGLHLVVLPHLHRHGLARLPRRKRHQLIGERLVVHPRRRAAEIRRRRQHCHWGRRGRPRQGHQEVVLGEPVHARPFDVRHPLADPKGMHVVVGDRADAERRRWSVYNRRVCRVAQLHLEILVGLHLVVLPHLHRHRLARLPRRKGHQLIGECLVVLPRRRRRTVERRHLHGHGGGRCRRPRQVHREHVRGEPVHARPFGLRHPLADPEGMHVVVGDRADAERRRWGCL